MLLVGRAPCEAALVAHYALDGNANDSANGFHGNLNGGPGFVASPVSGQALDLDGGQYMDTGATNAIASNLNVDGNKPKTISAWARTEVWNNGAIWDLGSTSAQNEYCLRTLTTTDRWRGQFWSGDMDFWTPGANNNWSHFALAHDGTSTRAYYNGMQVGIRNSGLNTNDGRPFEIGRYGGNDTFQGQVDDVKVYDSAEPLSGVRAEFLAAGGWSQGFDTSTDLPDDWYVSSGMNSTRVRTNRSGATGNILSAFDNDGSDPPGNVRNVYNVHQDHVTSQTFGSILTVRDETASLSFSISGGGGSHTFLEGSQRDGGLGLALWDLEANDYVRDGGSVRVVMRSGNGGLQNQSISLSGLQGRRVMPILVDRQVGGWGWVEVDTLSAPLGAVSAGNPVEHHRVRLDYHFDNPGDFMGWQQVDGAGNPIPITDFQIGALGGGGLVTRHINLDGSFAAGEGFLSSTAPGSDNGPTGVLRSPDFFLQGDLLEFYISGGSVDGLAFELVRSVDDVVLRSAAHQANANEFDYDFWAIGGLDGTEAYLRLVDSTSGSWGHIEVDGIRMLEFNVPEPATLVLCGAGFAALVRRRRRRRRG